MCHALGWVDQMCHALGYISPVIDPTADATRYDASRDRRDGVYLDPRAVFCLVETR